MFPGIRAQLNPPPGSDRSEPQASFALGVRWHIPRRQTASPLSVRRNPWKGPGSAHLGGQMRPTPEGQVRLASDRG